MCAVFGALIWSASPSAVAGANDVVGYIFEKSRERGRDGWGYHVHENPFQSTGQNYERKSIERNSELGTVEFFDTFRAMEGAVMVGNMRAEDSTICMCFINDDKT